jgi:hypothetical protein
MNRNVRISAKHCLLHFFNKDSLATNLMQWLIFVLIAKGFDKHQLNR